MPAGTFRAYNGARPTTAAFVPVTTGTVIKTLLQIAPAASTPGLRVVEWGIEFDGTSVAAPVKCELIETDVAATVTAFSLANDIVKVNNPTGPASTIQVGTALSGFTASAEGSITATRLLDAHLVAPNGAFGPKQFPLGREPEVQPGKFLRVRVTVTPAVNAVCWVEWEE